jgi:hypothetical protein
MALNPVLLFLGLILGLILCLALAVWIVRKLTAGFSTRPSADRPPAQPPASEPTDAPMDDDPPPPPLPPERYYVLAITDTFVICYRPDDTSERVDWADLQKVEIRTTSDGPLLPDVFWLLHGTSGGCSIPQGASGDKELTALLTALPGFDHEAFIQAMASTEEALFTCWTRCVPSSS